MHLSYERVQPNATYAPWLDDADYLATLEQVRNNTMVDHLRLWELWRLVEQAVRLPGDVLEVGVWRGGSGCMMAKRAKMLGSPAKFFLCDTFAGVVKTGAKDTVYVDGEHSDTSFDLVKELVSSMDLDNVELLAGIFPDDTGHIVQDRQFSLCHIDVDVYQSALEVLEWAWPRMPVGGIVVYDDYSFDRCGGITTLVNDRFGLPGSVMVHNLNGHAVLVKTAA